MIKHTINITLLLFMSISVPVVAETIGSQALNHCIKVTQESINHAKKQLPIMQKAAEAAAQSWIASNEIYTAGDPCATDELFYRAGGLIVRPENPAKLSVGDVMQPIVRRDDKNGRPTLLQPLSWTCE